MINVSSQWMHVRELKETIHQIDKGTKAKSVSNKALRCMLESYRHVTYGHNLCKDLDICIDHKHDLKMNMRFKESNKTQERDSFLKREASQAKETTLGYSYGPIDIESYGNDLYDNLKANKGHKIDERITKKCDKTNKKGLKACLGQDNSIKGQDNSINTSLGLDAYNTCGKDLDEVVTCDKGFNGSLEAPMGYSID